MSDDGFDEIDDGEDDDLAEMSCSRTSAGGCSQAGSEYCDWNCPFSSELLVNRIRRKRIDPRQGELQEIPMTAPGLSSLIERVEKNHG